MKRRPAEQAEYLHGLQSVREALLHHGDRIHHLAIAEGRRDGKTQELFELARQLGIPVHIEPREALTRRIGSPQHQGVIATVSPIRLAEFEALERRPDPRVLVLDGVEDPRNLGAVLRTADATAFTTVCLPHRRSSPVTPIAVKASAGAALHLRIVRIGNVAQTLLRLQELGYVVAGLDMQGTESWPDLAKEDRLALVLGGESQGLRRLVREACDHLLRLPMAGKVESLNLSVAAGIAMYRLATEVSPREVE